MFSTILQTVTDQGNSIHAYRAVARLAYEKAGEPSDHAAAFFVLGTIAEAFVERHERMPLLSKETEQSFAAFKEDIAALSAAYETGDPAGILAALNTVASSHAAVLI